MPEAPKPGFWCRLENGIQGDSAHHPGGNASARPPFVAHLYHAEKVDESLPLAASLWDSDKEVGKSATLTAPMC